MEECPICLAPLDNTITITGCCKKSFHTECYYKCMQQKAECPLCRSIEHVIQITDETTPIIVIQQENKFTKILGNVSIFFFALYTIPYIAYQIQIK